MERIGVERLHPPSASVLKTEHCALSMSKKEMLASLEEGTDGVRFSILTSLRYSKQNSQEEVVDVWILYSNSCARMRRPS